MTSLTSFCNDIPFENKKERFKASYVVNNFIHTLHGLSRLVPEGHLRAVHCQCPTATLHLIFLDPELQIRHCYCRDLLFFLPFIHKSSINRKSKVKMRVARSCELFVYFIIYCFATCVQLSTSFGDRGKVPRYGNDV